MAELRNLGRYELRHVLGQGAMGIVYEGFDPTLSRKVAIKTILRSHTLAAGTADDYSARFMREAKAAARLNHPNIVQVYDFGVEGEIAYLVMEFIKGRELRSFFDQNETFGIEESVRLMGELLEAMDFAHEMGIIHRDIKPANVMLDAQRRAKLADFGVARIQDGTDHSQGGTMVGTPAYMSPEQVQGGRIDRRTDIFSAGTILYEFLTGERPFKGAGAFTVAKMIVQDDPPPPSTVADTASPVFDEIVNKALAKNPADRFATARDFAIALKSALESLARGDGERSQAPKDTAPLKRTSASPRATDTELAFWRSMQDSSDPAEFALYLEQFPEGAYASLARLKIAKLGGVAPKAARPTVEETLLSSAPAPARRWWKRGNLGPIAAVSALVAFLAAGGAYLMISSGKAPPSPAEHAEASKPPAVVQTGAGERAQVPAPAHAPLARALSSPAARPKKAQPGASFRDCETCPVMMVIPAGSFLMGSPPTENGRYPREGPQHLVTIGRTFAAGKYEVTFDEWGACVQEGGCKYNPGDNGWSRGRRPVIDVSWDDAKVYVAWLSRKTGKTYRLLSEAEWEYAARGATTSEFHTGNTISAQQANYQSGVSYGGSPVTEGRGFSVVVGSYPPNAYGLHDVHGNVWEWVEDCRNPNYSGAPTDGSPWTKGDCSMRILRGGAWDVEPVYIRSASRYWNYVSDRLIYHGLRVASDLE